MSREIRIQVPAMAGANFQSTETVSCGGSELIASTSGLTNV
jgi:hypothetical protein